MLKPFFHFINSLDSELSITIPVLRDLAALGSQIGKSDGIIKRRLERRYFSLCRLQNELSRLNLKKAATDNAPTSLEDYVFSQIDFSRYREIPRDYFGFFLPEGITDFSEAFFVKNFRLGKNEVQALIEKSYQKVQDIYKIKQESPLILSIMRTLETSLEDLPLFTAEETENELNKLSRLYSRDSSCLSFWERPKGEFYTMLVSAMDNVVITHHDGMKTKLFISAGGDLMGTFRPGDKPWTRKLIAVKSD